jgi:hypothetical protein
VLHTGMHFTIPFHLSDAELLAELTRLAGDERGAVARLIAHLVVLDSRGSHLALGYSSLFAYCREALHLAEHEAYNRIEVARVARAFPELLGLIHDGALTPTAARLLAPVLTARNIERLLAAAAYRTKREVEELIAAERPRPDAPASIRKVPSPRSTDPAAPVLVLAPAESGPPASLSTPVLEPPASQPVRVAPLAPDRYEVRFTASAATCEKLRMAQDLLRHAVPDGDMAEIVDRALTALLDQVARQKFAVVRRPRPPRPMSQGSREPSAEVKRQVYLRDGGRCAFVARSGRRCNSRALLEFHHLRPYAAGGEATVGNIELRCRAHNQYEAGLFFGPINESRAQ